MAHDYIEHIKANTNIQYSRPSFLLPELNHPDANTFVLFKNFLNTLRTNDYDEEYNFILTHFVDRDIGTLTIPKRGVFTPNNVYGIVEFMNRFVSMYAQIVEEDEDGFIVTKVKSNKKLKNNPFFKNPTYGKIIQSLDDKEVMQSFLAPNIYSRNVLYSLSLEDSIDVAKDCKELQNTFLSKDVFNQYSFSYKVTPDNIDKLLNFLSNDLNLDKNDIFDILHEADVFNKSPIDYLLSKMDVQFEQLKYVTLRFASNSNSFYEQSYNEDITKHSKVYIDIIKVSSILMKYDSYIGEKIHASIFDPKDKLYSEVGIHFKKFKDTIDLIAKKNQNVHPSFSSLSGMIQEFELFKKLEDFDSSNPATANKSEVKPKKPKL